MIVPNRKEGRARAAKQSELQKFVRRCMKRAGIGPKDRLHKWEIELRVEDAGREMVKKGLAPQRLLDAMMAGIKKSQDAEGGKDVEEQAEAARG